MLDLLDIPSACARLTDTLLAWMALADFTYFASYMAYMGALFWLVAQVVRFNRSHDLSGGRALRWAGPGIVGVFFFCGAYHPMQTIGRYAFPQYTPYFVVFGAIGAAFSAAAAWQLVRSRGLLLSLYTDRIEQAARIKRAESRLSGIVSVLPVIIYEYSVETGLITLSTGRGLEGTGYEDGAAVGQHILSFPLSLYERTLHEAFLGGKTGTEEYDSQTDNRVYQGVITSDGVQVQGIIQDVTRTVEGVKKRESRDAQMALMRILSSS